MASLLPKEFRNFSYSTHTDWPRGVPIHTWETEEFEQVPLKSGTKTHVLSVDCLFLRSPSRVLYRTELIRTAYPRRISKCRISIQSTIVPVISLLVQWLTESRFPCWYNRDSAFRNSAFQSRFRGTLKINNQQRVSCMRG